MNKYFCDICGKEIKEVNMRIVHGNFDNYQQCVLDLCDECSEFLTEENLIKTIKQFHPTESEGE
jgi:ribosome-binding protein aMBF1 (putative translation factor)